MLFIKKLLDNICLLVILSIIAFISGCGLCPGKKCSLMGYINGIREENSYLTQKNSQLSNQVDEERSKFDDCKLRLENSFKISSKASNLVDKQTSDIESLVKENDGLRNDLKAYREDLRIRDEIIKQPQNIRQSVPYEQIHIVHKGDCLSKISSYYYEDMKLWPFIYWKNKKVIANPDLIYPNQILSIPDEKEYNKQQKGTAIKLHN